MTKRVSDMTPKEHAAHKEQRRAWRANNPDKALAERKRWQQSPAGKAVAKRAREKDREADPEAFLEKGRAYRNQSNARLRELDYQKFRAQRNAHHAKYYAGRTPEQRETSKAHYRRQHWRKHPMSPAKARQTVALLRAALPANIPAFIRDEVTQNIMLAITDGSIRYTDAAVKAPDFLRAYNRQFDHHKVKSLDENIPGMKSSWLDALPDDAERF